MKKKALAKQIRHLEVRVEMLESYRTSVERIGEVERRMGILEDAIIDSASPEFRDEVELKPIFHVPPTPDDIADAQAEGRDSRHLKQNPEG